jgi:hypothetical protein
VRCSGYISARRGGAQDQEKRALEAYFAEHRIQEKLNSMLNEMVQVRPHMPAHWLAKRMRQDGSAPSAGTMPQLAPAAQKALGGDLVNSTGDPSKILTIPAIPQQTGKKSTNPHTLRLLVPGDVDARISAEIKSTDGTFSPVGINGRVIARKKVIESPLDVTMASGKFALHISSDQPILGSVFSPTLSQGKKDFVWSTAAENLSDYTLATTGLAPTLVFTGDRIKVNLELTYTNGKTKKVTVSADDIATFVVGAAVRSVTFSGVSKGTSGAALISSKSGYGYIPLNPGSVLTKSSVPASNIRVLNP